MAKRTPRSSAEDTGTSPAQPKARRQRATRAAAPSEPSAIASDSRVEAREDENNSTGILSEAGDDAPLESISMGSEPSEEDIRMRAYHRYHERRGGDGTDFEDWLEAERELKGQKN